MPPAEPSANDSANTEAKKKRKRKILWFNPPFNLNVTTKVAQRFLELIDAYFHRDHIFRSLFNRNTVKVSYCTMKNMKAIIKGHNAKLLAPPTPADPKLCSCPRSIKDQCPLDGKCLTDSIIYKATVSVPGSKDLFYYGMCETDFKARLNNHNSSFRHRHLAKTSLARHIWSLKDEGKNYTIKWSIHRKAAPYQCGTRKCDLCLTEKAVIARADQATLTNARSELAVPCPHRRKYRFDKSKACR